MDRHNMGYETPDDAPDTSASDSTPDMVNLLRAGMRRRVLTRPQRTPAEKYERRLLAIDKMIARLHFPGIPAEDERHYDVQPSCPPREIGEVLFAERVPVPALTLLQQFTVLYASSEAMRAAQSDNQLS